MLERTRIEWARPCDRPSCIPRSRPRGTKGLGLSYERKFAKALERACPKPLLPLYGQWYEYQAAERRRFCQPDFVLISPLWVTIIETKLTNVEEASEQLANLYFPVLFATYRLPVRGIIAVRSLSRCPGVASITSELRTALDWAGDRIPILHWIGQGPL